MAFKNQIFHGEVDSSSATNGVAFTLYVDKQISAYTLDVTTSSEEKYWEFLVITDIVVGLTTAGEFAVFADTDNSPSTVGAGEVVARGMLAANSSIHIKLNAPISCPAGSTLTFKGPSGQCYATVHGYIRANP
jgi:hypothetical protein